MATDRQLSRNFWLHEFSGWRDATDVEVRQLAETVARVLQPIRSAFDPVKLYPSSWLEWSDGTRRTGSHAYGAIDFVMGDGVTRDAFEWGRERLIPAGYIGRWIYEPERTALEGVRQGEHVHVAPRSAMLAHVGDDSIQVLEETDEGVYKFSLRTPTLAAAALTFAGLVFFSLRDGRPV